MMVGTFFEDDDFEFMMLSALGATYHKGADIGECLSAAASIEDGDYEGWYRAWMAGDRRPGARLRGRQRGQGALGERQGGVPQGLDDLL